MNNLRITLAAETAKSEMLQSALEKSLRENADLHKHLQAQESVIDCLKDEIAYLRKILFAPSSEKRHSIEEKPITQLLFGFNEEANTPPAPPADRADDEAEPSQNPEPPNKGKKRGRKSLPDNLPREETKIDPGVICPICGSERCLLGEESCKQIEVIPAKVIVKVTTRLQRVCKNINCEMCDKIVIPPVEPQIIPQGLPTAGTVAQVVIGKFIDGLPLYRQEAQFARLGLDLSRNTLAGWVIKAGQACYTLGELLLEEVRAGPVINMDETKMQVLDEPGRESTAQSYMWVARGGQPDKPAIVFRYSPTRSGAVAADILEGYQGYLQTDGYSGYELVGKRAGIRHLGCLAHVRRKFHEAEEITKASPRRGIASQAMDLIKAIYAVERKADRAEMTPEQRKGLRQAEAKPLLDQFKALLDTYKDTVPPKGLLGKAITYAINQWDHLLVYLENGHLRPDNNLAENAIRPFVVGRKNWLFAYSQQGAEASAILYSLVETAKANGMDPGAYLRVLFTELPKAKLEADIKALLPQYINRERLTTIS